MNSDIVVIDDSPPTSPVKKAYFKNTNLTLTLNSRLNFIQNFKDRFNKMNLLPSESNKSETINDIINLTVEKEKDIIDPNLRKDLQARGVIIQSTKSKNSENRKENKEISDRNINTQQFANNLFGFHSNLEAPVYLPSYESYTLAQAKKNPSYYDNFANVKCDENYKFVQETFRNPPVNNESYSMQYLPEFIDINSFINYDSFGRTHFMSSENILVSNSIYQTAESATNSSVSKKPIFLKRTQTSSENSIKVIDLSGEDSNDKMETDKQNEIESADDDLEIVYVGAYAREPKYQVLPHTVYKLPAFNEEKENMFSEMNCQSPISVCESQNSQEGSSDDKNKGKRKRKPVMTVPRRNPKRQVQIEKDYLKLLDNVICESKKDAKPKKQSRKTKSSDNKKPTSSNAKKTRQPTNVGAVYRPPSPLSLHHLREWPQSGMHERPEYNPVTNKLEPFDTIIRNISVKYTNSSKIKTNPVPECSNEKKELKCLCHEMLHHVLAYSATVKSFISNSNENEDDKMTFMKDLSLTDTLTTPLNLTKSNKIFLYDSETKQDIEKLEDNLKELMGNSILLYNLTNEVSRDHLSTYINSIHPEDVIDWSNKQFNIVS